MKAIQFNLNDWLRQEAHVVAGHPFQMGDCSCLPVALESEKEEDVPAGFLVTHGADISYVPAHSANGEQMLHVWTKKHALDEAESADKLPAEYWYG
jgi:hypothetical protein